MAQAYFSLVTTVGKIKLAQSAAGGAPVVITHFAIGDGNGAETNPTAASTALVREVWRTPVESVVTDPDNPSAVLVTAIIPTNQGGWWMREFGIFDQAGAMIAVAKPVSQYKPTALEGQLEDIRYEFQIIIGETANVTLLVDPSLLFATRAWVEQRKVPMTQLTRLPWLPVNSMTVTAPPAAPAVGDVYLIPAGATGVWAGQANKLAEWTGSAWTILMPPEGHGVSLPNGRIFEKIAGVYVEFLATRDWVAARKVPQEQLMRLPWLPIIGMTLTAPPAGPAVGDTYLVPAAATGAWAGNVGKIAEWSGTAWALATPPDGHAFGLPDGRMFMKRGGTYSEYAATETSRGLVELATFAEVIAGTDNERAISPAGLAKGIGAYIGGDELTLWVRSDGNDANDGLENTAERAFKTLQGAVDFAMGRYGPGGKPIRLRLGLPGTYETCTFPAGASAAIEGNSAAPSDYTIRRSVALSLVSVSNFFLSLKGVRLLSTQSGRHMVDCAMGGAVDLQDVIFDATATPSACIRAAYGGVARLISGIVFAASAANAIYSIGSSINSVTGSTITFSGNPSFSHRTVFASNCGVIYLSGTTMAGAATGQRYEARTNGVIDTGGSGANFIPGNAAGTAVTGGVYV